MKRSIYVLFVSVMAVVSCKKKDNCPETTATAPASEVTTLRNYIQSNNINATEDPRGFFYTIDAAGSGSKPNTCSAVTVAYVGKLTNGTTFDSNTNASFYLSGLITGWQEGIPLIAPGGSITLYLPPSLAYGSQAQQGIPANSILVFKIDLKGVY
jgi:FKBP-type peptidyl-prolyl cis-trans isomerase FkpA